MTNTYHKDASALREAAQRIASKVTIRYMTNGTSRDVQYESAADEYTIIYSVAVGALLTVNWNNVMNHGATREAELQAVLDQAEFTLDALFENQRDGDALNGSHVNGYDTIYLPLRAFFDQWKEEV